MYTFLSGASLYFHGGFLVGPLSWCLEASVFLPAFKPIPKTRGVGFSFFSPVRVSNKLEKHMSEQKIDVVVHDGNCGWESGCGSLLIFWIAIMFLLSLLKALMTLASWFFIACLGIWGLFILVGIVREAWNWMRMLPHWRDNGRRMLVKGIGLALFAASLTLIVYYLVFVPEINEQILHNASWWKKTFGDLELKPEYTFLPPCSWTEVGILLMGMLGLIGSFIPVHKEVTFETRGD